ncbi:G2/mitotic-specific cyclin S13-7-like [Trifolium pratense]|uniref:G2/mitotic-specific cyclin S13-7-like n=1 Tax=Trifolium pratense TaxID=57577 RepID=UPI001E690B14|nr:G2/mitotic-specific cyclin S13-7-like [Trifolium pratense]
MASRIVSQQQPKGDAVVGGGKPVKKNGAAGEGRNRRALLDIGNVVTLKGVEVKPNRPVTRSFCAQLLANAQAAKANENNKKQTCANVPTAAVDGVAAVAKRVAPKPAVQKKVTTKPKPVLKEVIEISDEKDSEDKAVHKKKEADLNSKKKPSRTLTSVLTARSKAACGLTNKPKEIVDIDAGDANNELAAIEYLEDIYKFYKIVENENRPHDYMDSQPEINEKMRAILIDWLVDVHTKFQLSPEALYLTINIVDRFLAVKLVPRRELQLVGISAMLMASKYEEIWPPEVNDFVTLSDYAYTHEQILIMEKTILGKLEWTLTVPTPFVFLVRFIKAASMSSVSSVSGVPSDQEQEQPLENMAHFLSELGMMHYATLKYCPSMVAAAAVFAARCTLNKSPVWNETLKMHTGYSEEQLMDCAKLLTSFHSSIGNGKLKVVYRKYSDPQRGAVAVLPPAKNLLPAVGSV